MKVNITDKTETTYHYILVQKSKEMNVQIIQIIVVWKKFTLHLLQILARPIVLMALFDRQTLQKEEHVR